MNKYLFLALLSPLFSCEHIYRDRNVYFFEASEDFIYSNIELNSADFIETLNQAGEPFAHFNIRLRSNRSAFEHTYDPKSRYALTESTNAHFYNFLISKETRGENEDKRSFAAEIELLRLKTPTLLLSDSRAIVAPAQFWSDLLRILNSKNSKSLPLYRLIDLHDSLWLEYELKEGTYYPLALDLSKFLEKKDYLILKAHILSVEDTPSSKDFWVLLSK
ncbi:MAG: hypothetical protein WCK43_07365 [bacterium]